MDAPKVVVNACPTGKSNERDVDEMIRNNDDQRNM